MKWTKGNVYKKDRAQSFRITIPFGIREQDEQTCGRSKRDEKNSMKKIVKKSWKELYGAAWIDDTKLQARLGEHKREIKTVKAGQQSAMQCPS